MRMIDSHDLRSSGLAARTPACAAGAAAAVFAARVTVFRVDAGCMP